MTTIADRLREMLKERIAEYEARIAREGIPDAPSHALSEDEAWGEAIREDLRRKLARLQHTANARTVPTEPPPRNEGRALSVSR